MSNKQLTIEDVISQMKDMFSDPSSATPNRLIVNPAQMAVVRQMMDAGALANHPMQREEIYEAEEPDEVPKVQPSNNSK